MGHPLRVQKKDAIYFLTSRSLQERFFLRPSPKVNEIILGLLAKMADRYDVEIFAFVFMSNHFHMLARSQSLKLHLFMRDFLGQLARKLNKHWGRTGTFWGRRYASAEVLDDEALVDKLAYTVCNPCESNLVRHPKLWPGLSSYSIHKTGEAMVGKVVNRKLYWSLKRKKSNDLSEEELIEKATEEYPLQMAKLPKWAELDDEAYRERICGFIDEHALELARERNAPCLGRDKILGQSFDERPKDPKKSPRPACHTHCPQTRKEYIEQQREVRDRYRAASGKLREGNTHVSFPQGTIPPGHLKCVGGG